MNPRGVLPKLRASLLTHAPQSEWRPFEAFRVAIDFFIANEIEKCRGTDQDMLLYQWGTYDWGDGEHFEVDLTRQFMVETRSGDPTISQLSFTFRFAPSNALREIDAGDIWCRSRSKAGAFSKRILSSKPIVLTKGQVPSAVHLRYERV